ISTVIGLATPTRLPFSETGFATVAASPAPAVRPAASRPPTARPPAFTNERRFRVCSCVSSCSVFTVQASSLLELPISLWQHAPRPLPHLLSVSTITCSWVLDEFEHVTVRILQEDNL